MKLNQAKFGFLLLASSLLAACSSNDEDEATKVAELTEINAKFSPNIVWETSVGNGVSNYFSRLKPAVAYGNVYSASREGKAVALNVNSGKAVWSVDLSDIKNERGFFAAKTSARISGGPVIGAGKVFYGSENGYVYALEANTGKVLWQTGVKGEVIAAPAFNDETLVVNTASGILSALDINTGEIKWSAEQEVPPLSLRGISGVAVSSGGALIGEAGGQVSVFLLEGGQKGWSADVGEAAGPTELERVVDVDTTPIIFGDKVYAISSRGHLVALDLRSGRIIWKRQYSSFRQLAVEGNQIFATGVKGHVYAVDRNNGLEKWSQLALTNRGVTGPAVFGEYVVVGDFEGYLHWIEQDSGEIVARHQVDSSGIYVSPVVNNGVLYSQARNGDLQAISQP